MRLLIGLGGGALLIGGYFVMAMTMGAEIGQPCDKEWGCKGLDAMCLEGDGDSMCSKACKTGSDCPDGYACGSITTWTFDGKSANPEVGEDLACVPMGEPVE